MAYYLKDLPFTEEGKKLEISDEDWERFRLVYKKNGEDWTLYDIWGEGGDYGDDCIVVPLQSVYEGCIDINPGTEFANAIGTSEDPKPENINASWIGLWKCMYLARHTDQPPRICSTDGKIYSIGWEEGDFCHPQYPVKLDGAHVVLGTRQACIPRRNDIAYIIPICSRHNQVNLRRGDANIYMKTGNHVTFAVALSNVVIYIRNYLAQHPLETHEKI